MTQHDAEPKGKPHHAGLTEPQHAEEEVNYVTIGELARYIGLTVRTIQYYDQKGVVSPSAKGPQNQRLYSQENIDELYRVMTLKYLGKSLTEIKEQPVESRDVVGLRHAIDESMADLETQVHELLRKLTTLRTLQSSLPFEGEVDWKAAAQSIEAAQDDRSYLWHLLCVPDEVGPDIEDQEESAKEESVVTWHRLMLEALKLMRSGEPLTSPANQHLAKRYQELSHNSEELPERDFIFMGNIAHEGFEGENFTALASSIFDHLRAVSSALNEES